MIEYPLLTRDKIARAEDIVVYRDLLLILLIIIYPTSFNSNYTEEHVEPRDTVYTGYLPTQFRS